MSEAKRTTARRAGLDPEQITDQALALTRSTGLDAWSVRALAASLDVVPSVIYHYYPSKDDVRDAVCERVCALIELPDDTLPWDEWVLALLMSLRAVMLRHPGTARRVEELAKEGRPPRTLLPAIEGVLDHLRDAGFGQAAPLAYTMVANTALAAVATRDQQSVHSPHHHDLHAMVDSLGDLASQSDAIATLRDGFLARLEGEEGAALSERYFRLLIRSLLTGLEQTVHPGPR